MTVLIKKKPLGGDSLKWKELKDLYILEMLEKKVKNLKEFCEAHQVSYAVARQYSSKQNWQKELSENYAKKKNIVAQGLEVKAKEVNDTMKKAGHDEATIRLRNLNEAHELAIKAYEALKKRDFDKLSPYILLEIYKVMTAAERAAMGMPEIAGSILTFNSVPFISDAHKEFLGKLSMSNEVQKLIGDFKNIVEGEVLGASASTE